MPDAPHMPESAPADANSSDELRMRLRALEQPMELLEAIFVNAPIGLQIYARDGSCVLVNPKHSELFGGVPPAEYNVFEDTVLIERGVADLIKRAFAGERITIPPLWYDIRELRNVRIGNGRHFAVSAELVPLSSATTGVVEYVLFVFHDVTAAHQAREQAEAAAADANQARAAAQQAAAHAAFLAEAGRLLSASLDYETTLAQVARLATPGLADFCIVDIVGEEGTIRRVAAVHAQPDCQQVLDELCHKFPPHDGSPQPAMRAILARQPELLREVDPRVIAEHTRSAEHRELILRLGIRSHLAVPLVLGERTLGAISLGYVGERRYRIEDVPLVEALASRAAVAIQNARLYRDAEAARALAENANRTKDEFLAMLGHELRNPLAPIVTALELTRTREGPSRERTIIERQVQHMKRLVDDLLDVARIARGKLELSLAPVEMASIVHDGIELARPLIDERRHKLEIACPARGLALQCDRTRLAQVLGNLLTNAARYTDPGGTISVEAERSGELVRLSVRDTGMGISPELLPRIYDLFSQAQQTVERGRGGLGLGLAIVKSLVEQHGGQVRAHSEGPGRGSEFVVELPALRQGAAAIASDSVEPTSVHVRAGARILVVDDNEDAAMLLADALRARGYIVEVAYDPYEALQIAQRHAPDLALLDIGLPGMDGYELARLLSADGSLAKTRLVALTGYGQASDRSRSREAGFAEHLVKPVASGELHSVIERLLAAP